MSQQDKSSAGETFSSVPPSDRVNDAGHEKKTPPIFEGGVSAIFSPDKLKAVKAAKKGVEVKETSLEKMIEVAIGLKEYDETINPDKGCWNCTMMDHEKKQKEAGSHKESGKITAAAQFTGLCDLIVNIRDVYEFTNTSTKITSLDNSPLVMWTMTSLYLHVCLWLGSKLCTGCKNAVFFYLFQNFKRIIDSIVNNIKTVDQDIRETMDFLFFQKFSASQKKKLTGHDSLGNGLVSKEGSANFLWYFFRFMVNGKWDDKYPTNEQIMTIKTSAVTKVKLDAEAKSMAEKRTMNHEKLLVKTKELNRDMKERQDLMLQRNKEILDNKTFKRRTAQEIQLQKKYAKKAAPAAQTWMTGLVAGRVEGQAQEDADAEQIGERLEEDMEDEL